MGRNCPVCGEYDNKVLYTVELALPKELRLPASYNVACCERCGMCYADTEATEEDYEHYYKTYNNYSAKEANAVSKIICSKMLNLIEREWDKTARVLEMGFGSGGNLILLKGNGYSSLTGIDPSAQSVENLQKHGIKAYLGSAYDDPSEIGKDLTGEMDMVLLSGVLEHLYDPKRALVEAEKYLNDSGRIVVIIPDYSAVNKINKPIPDRFNQEHINYFSICSIKNLLKGTGLRIGFYDMYEVKLNGRETDEAVLTVILERRGNVSANNDEKKDDVTVQAITRYIDARNQKRQSAERLISGLKAEQKPVIVWGTGALAMSLLSSTELSMCNIVAFVDSNPLKAGTYIADRVVEDPSSIHRHKEAAILICAMNYCEEIKKQILEMGADNEIIML